MLTRNFPTSRRTRATPPNPCVPGDHENFEMIPLQQSSSLALVLDTPRGLFPSIISAQFSTSGALKLPSPTSTSTSTSTFLFHPPFIHLNYHSASQMLKFGCSRPWYLRHSPHPRRLRNRHRPGHHPPPLRLRQPHPAHDTSTLLLVSPTMAVRRLYANHSIVTGLSQLPTRRNFRAPKPCLRPCLKPRQILHRIPYQIHHRRPYQSPRRRNR